MPRQLVSFFASVCFLIVITFTACTTKEKPVTKTEATEFAQELERSIVNADATFMDAAMDAGLMLERSGVKTGKNKRAITAGMSNGLKMGTAIINALSKTGSYQFVNEYSKKDTEHVIFRLYDHGMINYHDLELAHVDGKVKIADLFIYLTGQNLSETMQSLFAQMGDVSSSEGPSKETLAWMDDAKRIRGLITAKQYREAKNIYTSLPETAKKSKAFQVINVEINSGLGDDEYGAAIAEYESLFPKEPNMQLMMLDAYIMRKEYDKALNAVNELDKTLNTDPLLDYHRSLCYSLMNDTAKQLESLERLNKNVPDFEDGMIQLIALYLDKEEYEKARPLVDRYKSKSNFDQLNLSNIMAGYPEYEEKYGRK
jgi:tetratricopeptide (TPR) repeat protein